MTADTPAILAEDIQTFVFYVTERCNLRCKHCLLCCGPDRNVEMPEKLFMAGIESISGTGAWSDVEVGLTGGETLVHPAWERMVGFARDRGFKVGLVTNGTLLRKSHLSVLRDPLVRVSVSLDGPRSAHDDCRGKGTFKRTVRGLDLLSEAQIEFDLHVTVLPSWVDRLEEFIGSTLARYPGVRSMGIVNVLPLGRAAEEKSLIFDEDELRELFFKCQTLKTRHLATSFRHFLHQREYALKHPCKVFACWKGKCHRNSTDVPAVFNVRATGEVLPLWASLDSFYAAGNVGNEPLAEMIYHYLGSGRHQRLLRLLTDVFEHRVRLGEERKIIDWAGMVIEESGRPGRSRRRSRIEVP